MARLTATASRFRGGNQTMARKAKVLDRRVERLAAEGGVPRPRRRPFPKVKWPDPPRAGDVVLVAEGLAKAYGDTPVFDDVSFTVERGDTLLVLGPQRRRQDHPAAHPGRAAAGRRGRDPLRGQRRPRASTPRSTRTSGPA